jgi:protein-disulfide isomerase
MLNRRLTAAALVASLVFAGPALAAVPKDAVTGDMSLGNPKAKVRVIEYASASCPHCAHFNETVFPDFKKKYIDTGRVYYTLREFLTQPVEVSAAGFIMARCGGRAKYFTILDQVFRSQPEWKGDLRPVFSKIGQDNGLTEAQLNACFEDEAAMKALNSRVKAAAEVEKVSSTPTFDVNGKRIEGAVPLTDLDKAIEEAEQGAPAAKPAHAKKAKRR